MTLGPLVAIYGVWALLGIGWVATARWRAPAVARGGGSGKRGTLLLILLGYLGLFAEPPGRIAALWRTPAALGWALVALAVVGGSFAWWARLHLGDLWSGGITRREGHRVVDDGPYGVVRHPIYTGLIAAALALALVKASLLALGGAALIGIGFALKAKIEERFLSDALGRAAYAAYKARVPMLVPGLR